MKYLFGENALKEAIKLNIHINIVYLTKNKTQLINLLNQKQIKFQLVDANFFSKYSNINHQNILTHIEINNIFSNLNDYLNSHYFNPNKKHLYLMLDSIEDPRNFGAIIRTAYALGVDCIIYKKNNQVDINDLVSKISMGACYFINMVCVSNLINAINILKNNQTWIYAANLNKEAVLYDSLAYDDDNICLIVGNEQKGISNLITKNADFNIYIKMANNFNSLNVSVASGILINHIISKQNQ